MMARMPWWAWLWPLLARGLLVATFMGGVGGAVVVAAEAVVLVATVFAAVWHAEVVAHRVGEPFGTLVLALAVTVFRFALPGVDFRFRATANLPALPPAMVVGQAALRKARTMRSSRAGSGRVSPTEISARAAAMSP